MKFVFAGRISVAYDKLCRSASYRSIRTTSRYAEDSRDSGTRLRLRLGDEGEKKKRWKFRSAKYRGEGEIVMRTDVTPLVIQLDYGVEFDDA